MTEELPQSATISRSFSENLSESLDILTSFCSTHAVWLFFHTFTFSCTFLSVFYIPSWCINCITKALSFIFYHPKGNYTENTGPWSWESMLLWANIFHAGKEGFNWHTVAGEMNGNLLWIQLKIFFGVAWKM